MPGSRDGARGSGRGQVVDAAMTDGAATLMSMMYTLKAMGQWTQERGSNLLDGGAGDDLVDRVLGDVEVDVGPLERRGVVEGLA